MSRRPSSYRDPFEDTVLRWSASLCWPLDKALDLLANCQRAYLAAPDHLRRQWNQALFERLVVYDDSLADPSFPLDWVARPSTKSTLF